MNDKRKQALERYNDAVAKRAAELGTVHTYAEARAAAGSLTNHLCKQADFCLLGVGVGLAVGGKDLELIALVRTDLDALRVPTVHDGITVRAIISGEATAS